MSNFLIPAPLKMLKFGAINIEFQHFSGYTTLTPDGNFTLSNGAASQTFRFPGKNFILEDGQEGTVVWAVPKGADGGPAVLFGNHATGQVVVNGPGLECLFPTIMGSMMVKIALVIICAVVLGATSLWSHYLALFQDPSDGSTVFILVFFAAIGTVLYSALRNRRRAVKFIENHVAALAEAIENHRQTEAAERRQASE